MRQRITYLLPQGSGVNPADIKVDDSELTFARADDAAEERHITVGLSELPKELQSFLEDYHELHIRLASPQNQHVFSPAVSRVPPGLHIFFTPRKQGQDTKLCSHIQEVLGATNVKCNDSADSFSKPPILSERFTSSSTYQFFHGPDDLRTISLYFEQQLCLQLEVSTSSRELCQILAASSSAAYIDYDFDVISHAVTITILSTSSKDRIPLRKLDSEDRLEVGILAPEIPDESEELKLGGYLTVIGEDTKPSPVLFSFPARHHPLPASTAPPSYSISFQQPTGLHPKLEITFSSQQSLQPPKDDCALHTYLTLPSSIFIDRYQFSDALFLASQNLIALHSLSGEQDLEAPDWTIQKWGSAALFELAHPDTSSSSSPASPSDANPWTITIPTHLRYLNSTTSTSHSSLRTPHPILFWACPAEEGLKMSTNPFDRINLGYDGLFGPKTMFYHIPPPAATETLYETIAVPVLDTDGNATQWVPLGTMIAVLMGFGWICFKLLSGKVEGLGFGVGGGVEERREKKKK